MRPRAHGKPKSCRRAIAEYDPAWLDEQCLAGRIVWTRLATRAGDAERGAAPVRSTPIALLARRNVRLWSSFAERPETPQLTPKAQQAAAFIQEHGASFFDEIVEGAHLLPTQVEEALAELVALGIVNSDSFGGLRALLVPSDRRGRVRAMHVASAAWRSSACRTPAAGRW